MFLSFRLQDAEMRYSEAYYPSAPRLGCSRKCDLQAAPNAIHHGGYAISGVVLGDGWNPFCYWTLRGDIQRIVKEIHDWEVDVFLHLYLRLLMDSESTGTRTEVWWLSIWFKLIYHFRRSSVSHYLLSRAKQRSSNPISNWIGPWPRKVTSVNMPIHESCIWQPIEDRLGRKYFCGQSFRQLDQRVSLSYLGRLWDRAILTSTILNTLMLSEN